MHSDGIPSAEARAMRTKIQDEDDLPTHDSLMVGGHDHHDMCTTRNAESKREKKGDQERPSRHVHEGMPSQSEKKKKKG